LASGDEVSERIARGEGMLQETKRSFQFSIRMAFWKAAQFLLGIAIIVLPQLELERAFFR